MSFRSQRELEIELSKLQGFVNPSFKLEQYQTPEHIAAEWAWSMALKGEVAGKIILDAACGPGILGIAMLLMGAKQVYFLDKDESAIQICIKNYERVQNEYEIGTAEFLTQDISLFDQEVEIAIQNPPFGTKEAHVDKKFLEKAFSVAPIVYSMHKYSTKEFVEAICKHHSFEITDFWRYEFPIKATFAFHKKPMQKIDVGLWRMEKKV